MVHERLRLRSKLLGDGNRRETRCISVRERDRSCALHSHIGRHEGWRVSQPSSVWRRVRAYTDLSWPLIRERKKKRKTEREKRRGKKKSFVVFLGNCCKMSTGRTNLYTRFIDPTWNRRLIEKRERKIQTRFRQRL